MSFIGKKNGHLLLAHVKTQCSNKQVYLRRQRTQCDFGPDRSPPNALVVTRCIKQTNAKPPLKLVSFGLIHPCHISRKTNNMGIRKKQTNNPSEDDEYF